jgi:hypothetical protein
MEKLNTFFSAAILLTFFINLHGQDISKGPQGHLNSNKFKQLKEELPTPNKFRTASGAPGQDYYQQKVDYVINVELDDKNKRLYGQVQITYTNNSPDELEYLWLQLDQNIRKKDAPALQKNSEGDTAHNIIYNLIDESQVDRFASRYIEDPFDGGFNIQWVKDEFNQSLSHIINMTMMRVDLPQPLKKGEEFKFSIKWWYNINDHVKKRARSGYEPFPKDGNRLYVIAQFFPRLAVYNDVEGWQNHQFWGNGEFALNFGNYEVNITVPADHILEATGVLQNPKEVLSRDQYRRYKRAEKSFDEPVIIVSQEEAEINEKGFSEDKKTWKFIAENVRDFAFASSRKFIWEMMAVQIGDKNIMAVSLYPKEGNPLWEQFSSKAVVQTLKTYSKFTFDYPYPKAVSVHSKNQGMEYPMICWNYGRPDEDGTYSIREKYGMISVIIHEIGHNFFPMIVNSDERQWGWMDEGLNTFVQYLTEQEFARRNPLSMDNLSSYPSRRGDPKLIVDYMAGDQSFLSPIMSNPENIYQLGPNAYGKPATALNILRETVMGHELFDYAFKTYSNRWKFKHPTPADFFRTMEDASAVDLDWFWRGWFYTTDYVDIGIKSLKKLQFTNNTPLKAQAIIDKYGITNDDYPFIFLEEEDSIIEPRIGSDNLKAYLDKNDNNKFQLPKNFYEITFEKPGGLVMPILVEYNYMDGSSDRVKYPTEIWRKNDEMVKKIIATNKQIKSVILDPDFATSDVDVENNIWPKKAGLSEFEQFKSKTNR